LAQRTVERIAARSVAKRMHAGEWLFRHGDAADGVYVVVSGRLEVVSEDGELLRVLGPQSVVGELALLADSKRSASIRARRDSELLKLTRERFDALVADDPHFTRELVRLIGVQLQRSRALEPPGPSAASVIALVPARDGLPMEEIGRALARELGSAGSAVRLAGPARSPLDPAAEAALLERHEQEEDVVVLSAEREGDWRDFCMQHADRIALVAGGGPPPPELHGGTLAGCNLLFLTEGAGEMGAWIDAIQPRAHHLLEPGDRLAPSVAAAARRLAGHSVGLVLSGGGARAFATSARSRSCSPPAS
jgi:NTE family protein